MRKLLVHIALVSEKCYNIFMEFTVYFIEAVYIVTITMWFLKGKTDERLEEARLPNMLDK